MEKACPTAPAPKARASSLATASEAAPDRPRTNSAPCPARPVTEARTAAGRLRGIASAGKCHAVSIHRGPHAHKVFSPSPRAGDRKVRSVIRAVVI
ncbi:hypothetical protein GCM10023083_21500 [Streptomyces phyllanthi]